MLVGFLAGLAGQLLVCLSSSVEHHPSPRSSVRSAVTVSKRAQGVTLWGVPSSQRTTRSTRLLLLLPGQTLGQTQGEVLVPGIHHHSCCCWRTFVAWPEMLKDCLLLFPFPNFIQFVPICSSPAFRKAAGCGEGGSLSLVL